MVTPLRLRTMRKAITSRAVKDVEDRELPQAHGPGVAGTAFPENTVQ